MTASASYPGYVFDDLATEVAFDDVEVPVLCDSGVWGIWIDGPSRVIVSSRCKFLRVRGAVYTWRWSPGINGTVLLSRLLGKLSSCEPLECPRSSASSGGVATVLSARQVLLNELSHVDLRLFDSCEGL